MSTLTIVGTSILLPVTNTVSTNAEFSVTSFQKISAIQGGFGSGLNGAEQIAAG